MLAAAGLERLGRIAEASELLDLAEWPTAPAQGALALEIRADASTALAERVATVDDTGTRAAATAERGVLERLEAGCSAPIAAHASVGANVMTLTAAVFAPDGTRSLTVTEVGDRDGSASELADRVAEQLLERGAAALAPLGAAR